MGHGIPTSAFTPLALVALLLSPVRPKRREFLHSLDRLQGCWNPVPRTNVGAEDSNLTIEADTRTVSNHPVQMMH